MYFYNMIYVNERRKKILVLRVIFVWYMLFKVLELFLMVLEG